MLTLAIGESVDEVSEEPTMLLTADIISHFMDNNKHNSAGFMNLVLGILSHFMNLIH